VLFFGGAWDTFYCSLVSNSETEKGAPEIKKQGGCMKREHVVPSLVSLVIFCFLTLQSGIAIGDTCPPAVPACPPGTTYNAGANQCLADFFPCLPGYSFNALSNKCEVSAPVATSSASCPVGSSFNPSFGKCETANLVPCQSGYTYNVLNNKCEIPATFIPAASCPTGYTFDAGANKCVGGPSSACTQGGTWGYYEHACCSGNSLPGFSWDDETGQYIGPWGCPPAYSVNNYTGSCSGPMVTANCPAGSTINAWSNKCEAAATAACAAGQTYNPYTTKCDFAPPVTAVAPTCPSGYILNVDTNVCVGIANSACTLGGSYGGYEHACCSADPLSGFGWDDETGQYTGPWSCPTGFALITGNGSCSGTACQAGYAFNAATSSCQPSGCPAGTVKSDNLCISAAVCLP
jgi:hypothetical protein